MRAKRAPQTPLPPPTTRGEVPLLWKLPPLQFQGLCRDLYELEPGYQKAEVYGTSGQSQRGIDIVARRQADDGVDVGQCKCVTEQHFTPGLIRAASEEFLQHLDYWREMGVRRFVLFVGSEATRRQVQEEEARQIRRFRDVGLDYELWSAAHIVAKLRHNPGIIATHLGQIWVSILCGEAPDLQLPAPRDSIVVNGILSAQVEVLAGHVASGVEKEVEDLRSEWRRGQRKQVVAGLDRLCEPSRWQVLPASLKATIHRFRAQIALEAGDLQETRSLSDAAEALNPAENRRLRALIHRAEGNLPGALALTEGATEPETLALRAGLLLEKGDVAAAQAVVAGLAGHAEGHRLRALVHLLRGEMQSARLEIGKALELAPGWHSVIYTGVIINYLSALSPAVVPRGLPGWPEPADWPFVKTDDRSCAFLKAAAEAAARLIREAEPDVEEIPVYQAWQVASIANDPARQDEAAALCRAVLARDPANYRVFLWTMARNFPVDLNPSVQSFSERIGQRKAQVEEVIALVVWHLQRGESADAYGVLQTSRDIFVGAGAEDLWRIWSQRTGHSGQEPEAVSDAEERRPDGLADLQTRALAGGEWEPLLQVLRAKAAEGSDTAAFELCSTLASQGRWEEAAAVAPTIVEKVQTAEAVRLAAVVLHNARQFETCLRVLDEHMLLFPHAELPNELQRVQIAARRELGLLPAATTAAEELFRREPSPEHYITLCNLYFEKGDFASLAALSRKHQQFGDLTVRQMLGLAMRVGDADAHVGRELWGRAASGEMADEDVTAAVEVGYKLALDREMRPLLRRLYQMAERPQGFVRRMDLAEVRQLLLERRSEVDRVYTMYENGEIPVHLFAGRFRRPLSFWFHRLLELNQRSAPPAQWPVPIRNGWRVGASVQLVSDAPVRLHADLTSLLLAAHFRVLDKIEEVFHPICLPHGAVVALAAMREATRVHQPSRGISLRAVSAAVARGAIEITNLQDGPVPGRSNVDKRAVGVLDVVVRNGWLLVDLSAPDIDADGDLSVDSQAVLPLLRTPHAVVDALRALAELADADAKTAFEAFGEETIAGTIRHIDRGARLLCRPIALELLSSAGVLDAATRTFRLCVEAREFRAFVAHEIEAMDAADADVEWLTDLMERLHTGIENGTYLVLRDFEHGADSGAPESPDVKCLLDLLKFPVTPGDAIWSDDRWVNGHVQRDGAPILDTLDLLYELRRRNVLTEGLFLDLQNRFRTADVRFTALEESELLYRLRHADLAGGRLVEPRELRSVRQHYARSLANGETLRVSLGGSQHTALEWPFLLASGRAIADAVVGLCAARDEPLEVGGARAEWLLANLYTPDRGRCFTRAERTPELDKHLEAVALSGFLTYAMKEWGVSDDERRVRRLYLDWIYRRILGRRFEVDPELAVVTSDLLKTIVAGSLEGEPALEQHRKLARAVLGAFVLDLPEELSSRLTGDGEFARKCGLRGKRVARIGPHSIDAKDFWGTAARAYRERRPVALEGAESELTVSAAEDGGNRHLVVQSPAERRQYIVLGTDVGLLSDSVTEREAAIRAVGDLLDLPGAEREQVIARIATLEDCEDRINEMLRLRSESAESDYRELETKLRSDGSVEESDFLPEHVEALVRHLRLRPQDSGHGFSDALNAAAGELVADAGIEQAIVRLAGLPVALCPQLRTAVAGLDSAARRALFKRLLPNLTGSPLGIAHSVTLLFQFASERASYGRLARAYVKRETRSVAVGRNGAWLAVLRYCANEFTCRDDFRRLPAWLRLCVVWSHGDRLFRLLTASRVEEQWIGSHFEAAARQLPPEIAWADEAYTSDASYPRRVTLPAFSLAALAYATDGGRLLDPADRIAISERVEAEPSILVCLMRDATLASDSIGSILREYGGAPWSAILGERLAEGLKPSSLRRQAMAALERIASGEGGNAEWGLVHVVLQDFRLPDELAAPFAAASLATNFTRLYTTDENAGLIAVMCACQHAARLGTNVVSHVREHLLGIVENTSSDKMATESENKTPELLLTAAFHLCCFANDPNRGNRFTETAQLLEELVRRQPALVERCQLVVDRLVEGLPNADSRLFWQLQVKLRALR